MTRQSSIERYLSRHALAPAEWDRLPPPDPELRLCVVIPCLAESSRIGAVLDSLAQGSERQAQCEVILVVNQADDAPRSVALDNQDTLDLLAQRPEPRLYVLDRASTGRAWPADRAGVGLARRTGMDLALARLAEAGASGRSAIACLDGDSTVAPGYVDALLAVFDHERAPLGGVCACFHPLPREREQAAAIVAYETWMRYFELGLTLSGSPFSYPTIGSCLVASASGYALADGMPPRQAGEDFYFAQKLIKVGRERGLVRIPGAQVQPAARLSHRVPFGTGRALLKCRAEGLGSYRYVEPPQTFLDLGRWFSSFEDGFSDPQALLDSASPHLREFLEEERAWSALDSIRANQSRPDRFALAAHHWFDGLRCVRFAHACARDLGRVWAYDALGQVLEGLHLVPDDLVRPERDSSELELMVDWLERLRSLA